MSLFPAYSDGDSVSSRCNEQEIWEGYAVDTGLFCFKALCGMWWGGDGVGILLFSVVNRVDKVLRFVYCNFLENAYMFR
jgi:hypothetical protein